MGYRIVALTVSTALFMQFLDSTSLIVAIPAMAHDFGVPAIDLNVAILAYQLAMTALIPVGSVIAERIGQRNAFALALCVFIVGSVGCALSASLPQLVAARALQGTAGAVMMPVSRLLVIRSVDKSELLNAMNWLLLPAILGPLMGPVVAGQIVTHVSWHWIFVVNIPVAAIGAVMTMLVVPDIRDRTEGSVDVKGILLIGPAIVALMFGLEGAVHPKVGWQTPVLLAAALLLFWLFLRHVRRVPAPVLDLSLLRIDSFRHSLVTGAIFRIIALASGFVLPLWFQLAMGFSAAKTGTILVASALGTIASRLLGVKLTQTIHPRTVALVSLVLTVVSFVVTSQLDPAWPEPVFLVILFAQGLLLSLAMMVVNAVGYVNVAPERTGQAAALYTMVQQLTMSLGVTLGVWTINGMRIVYGVGERDGRVYAASFAILAALSFVGALTARKMDAEMMGELQPKRQPA